MLWLFLPLTNIASLAMLLRVLCLPDTLLSNVLQNLKDIGILNQAVIIINKCV
uniref:Uncharacterized protein n=1 Tax=Phakopsora pachyrhizi TaxID=170000 RepID=A0A0S1MJF9_PHAPC